MEMDCDRKGVRSVIDAMFLKRISGRRWRSVREHLYACRSCQAYYNQVLTLHRKVHRETAPLSQEQLLLIGEEIVQRTAARSRNQPRVALHLKHIGIGLAVAAVAVVAGPWLLQQGSDSQFQARGFETSAGVGVRAFCIVPSQSGDGRIRAAFPAQDTPNDSLAGPSPACRIDDVVQFAYSNSASDAGPTFEYLFLFGVDERLEPLWYYPHPQEAQSVPIATGRDAVNVPLPGGVRLGVNHRPGIVRVYGLFTKEPLAVQTVEDRLVSLRTQVSSPRDLSALGVVNDGGEVSFLMPIEE